MTLTVRHEGQLLSFEDGNLLDKVVAVSWFDAGEGDGRWGGIIEPSTGRPRLEAQVRAGQTRYRLRLDDGREGVIELGLSEFEADGVRPFTYSGIGQLARRQQPDRGQAAEPPRGVKGG